ncbi:MAG TPA: hypothetical protein VEU08_17240 [Vicinamibacterales bacterium]|nr:hypothetical protein [Vicinamibacterales bacterium]
MADSMRERLDAVHPKMLAAELKTGETDRKPLAEAEWRQQIGRLIERALELAHLTKQDISFAMGYPPGDQSAISRWIAAVERPQFDKLFAVDRFYDAWVIASAEANPRVQVETVVRVQRIA